MSHYSHTYSSHRNHFTRRLLGAGIVPFMRDGDGEPLFLFCRERAERHWRASNKLSSFGGGAKVGEVAPLTAVREFREESMHTFPTHDLVDELRRGAYALRVITHQRRGTTYHVTYVREVALTDWRTRFETTRVMQVQIHSTLSEWTTLRNTLQDKLSLPLPSLECGWVDVRFAEWVMYASQVGACPTHITGITGARHRGEEVVTDARTLDPTVCEQYVRWCALGRSMHVQRAALRARSPGMFRNASFEIDESFLETDAIQCWSYTDLRAVSLARVEHLLFRRQFLPILNALLREFAPSRQDRHDSHGLGDLPDLPASGRT